MQVSTNHESLLRQVSHIKELEGTLGVVSVGVVALQQSIERCVPPTQRKLFSRNIADAHSIKQEISEPFFIIQQRTLQLERLQVTTELLRQTLVHRLCLLFYF